MSHALSKPLCKSIACLGAAERPGMLSSQQGIGLCLMQHGVGRAVLGLVNPVALVLGLETHSQHRMMLCQPNTHTYTHKGMLINA
jgi:hypothetical protein